MIYHPDFSSIFVLMEYINYVAIVAESVMCIVKRSLIYFSNFIHGT